MSATAQIHGLMAEFASAEEILTAAETAYAAGYRSMDAYSPFPVHGLAEAIGFRRTWLPLIVLLGGLTGCLTGFALQYWVSALEYPVNIGGRPLASWPSFVVVSFELTILFAALSTVVGMIVLNRLPMPYHPVFNAPAFQRASRDRFFLCIESGDRKFDPSETRQFLETLHPESITEVQA